jgi:glycosyltransferase involved in cell wall biosynthesis
MDEIELDLIAPKSWTSNLVGEIEFANNSFDNTGIRNVYPIETYFKGNGSIYFYHLIKLWKVLFKNQYDLIIINQENWSFSLLFFNLINFFTRNRKTKLFLMIAQNIKKEKLKWAIPLEKFNLQFVNLIVGCCSETEDVLRWKKINTPWRILPLFYNSALESKDVKPYKGDNLKLGFIGRLSYEKGIDTLLQSYEELRKEESLELIIAGDGPLRDEVENSSANYLGLLPHNAVKSFYEKIDVLVVPSISTDFWKEQFGRVIAEAVAHGVPVIGSSSGAIPEVLAEVELEYVFDEANVSSLNKVINKLIVDIKRDDFPSKMENAQNLCRQKFSEQAFINRIVEYDNE